MQKDSYNRGGFIAFVFSMVFSLGFFIYVSLIHEGIDLKEIPQAAEQTVAEGEAAPAAVDTSKITDPWVENEAMIQQGAKVYAQNCAVCHGEKGAGDGAAGQALTPKPRDLIAGQWTQSGDSAGLFKTITEGIPGTSMAPFGHLPVNDRWALVQFIHSITKNKVADDAAKLEAFAKSAK